MMPWYIEYRAQLLKEEEAERQEKTQMKQKAEALLVTVLKNPEEAYVDSVGKVLGDPEFDPTSQSVVRKVRHWRAYLRLKDKSKRLFGQIILDPNGNLVRIDPIVV